MRKQVARRAVVAGGFVAAFCLLMGSSAQELRAQDDAFETVPQPVSIYVHTRPTVTVALEGAYGRVQVTGVLEAAPESPLTVEGRETGWAEVLSLTRIEQPAEGFPKGSYSARLLSEAPLVETAGGGYGSLPSASIVAGSRRLSRLPEGTLRLSGSPYGMLEIETERILSYQLVPVRGTVAELPAGDVRIEILPDKTVPAPLPQVQRLYRDQRAGTVAVTLADEQVFTGKLVELPDVQIAVDGPARRTLALDQVLLLERGRVTGRL